MKPTGIEALVCEEIAQRQQLGINKYGTTVADNNLSLREWLNHQYEELLDAAVYCRRAIAEIDATAKSDLAAITSQEVAQTLIMVGWTQKQISDAIGLTQPNISRIVSGKQDLRWKQRAALCALLDQTPPRYIKEGNAPT
jgi:DNA-binding Xre family transcriptional regulator